MQGKGTLYGVSVGPGDPELLTLKAHAVLTRCPVIAAPVTHRGNTLALDIVRGAMDITLKEILPLEFLMTSDEKEQAACHAKQVDKVVTKLEQGQDVAMVNLGDVTVFSTFSYMARAVQERGFDVEMIPGVTSFCACACALFTSLTDMRQPLHIIPASFVDTKEALSYPGTKVLLKSASAFDRVKADLEGEHASAVVDCGRKTQKVYRDLNDMQEPPSYFTTIIVKPKD